MHGFEDGEATVIKYSTFLGGVFALMKMTVASFQILETSETVSFKI